MTRRIDAVYESTFFMKSTVFVRSQSICSICRAQTPQKDNLWTGILGDRLIGLEKVMITIREMDETGR